ncbi:hypothetical protein NOSIN_21330 [Nocardiopsis sinuspersici]|uniref:Uncharacterized protein n=1 Tax=Nocardiopsis sinuspersici TaxID=501010 RepID=A0A1V3C6E5_9ACTN|nr:hypothetical protein NOSIN_21330 [Nocardiopsis sinuspersici]
MVNAFGSADMHHLMALLSLFLRVIRPTRGLHAAPLVLTRELRAEARRRRVSRVRRFVADLGTVASVPVPPAPAPRPAPGDTPRESLPVVDPPEAFVRGYYMDYEIRQRRSPGGDLPLHLGAVA